MSEHKDEKWLDEQLQRAVDGSTPVFDAQAWKQKYAHEYETLTRRAVGWGLPHRFSGAWWLRWGKPRPTARFAIAATLVIAAGVLLSGRFGMKPPASEPQPVAQEAPAQMVSMISLSAAFRRGGIDELDKQCDRALERLGPRPTSVTVQELLKDINKG